MRIAVVGAAGRLGRAVVAEAAHRGHEVTGLARSAEALRGVEGLGRRVVGDAREEGPAGRAVEGADAVICTVAGGSRRDHRRAQEVASALVVAMSRLEVTRLVMTSAYPIVARRPALAMTVLRRVFAIPYRDAAAAEEQIVASSLDWTIVRLNRLSDQATTGRPHVAEGQLDRATGLTRGDGAALLVDLVEDGRHVGRAVNVRGQSSKLSATPWSRAR